MEEKKQTNGKKNERDFESESSFFVFPFLVLFFSESSFFVFPFFVLFFHDVLALQSSSDGPTEQTLRAAAAARAVPALEQSRPRDSRRASDGTTPTVRGPRRRGPCVRAAPPCFRGAPPDDRHRSKRPAARDQVERASARHPAKPKTKNCGMMIFKGASRHQSKIERACPPRSTSPPPRRRCFSENAARRRRRRQSSRPCARPTANVPARSTAGSAETFHWPRRAHANGCRGSIP